MHYFFKEGSSLAAGRLIELDPDDLNHAYRVLRLRENSVVAVADGRGAAFKGIIESIGQQAAFIRLGDPLPAAESPLRIVLLQGLAKGEKMDLIIRQATELGVQRIVPIVTERSIPRLDESREANRLKRWRKVARAAAAQCRRAFLPEVFPVHDFNGALSLLEGREALVPWEEEKECGLESLLKQPLPAKEAVYIFIGPEGGFGMREIEALTAAGARTFHLGPRILRTETAAAVTVGLIQAAWGDLGVGSR
ncbi:MAG TPA: 16S rRNA (uracil(1498)-N(3))-methyltransferase [Bacillota bacterium]|jgi:16S rRNA (uracil1498-N3)-methyltransferase|nr:16S rRNA (uracil(1498)-N(3))-methyltransferase [Bacillota bacterium]HOJ84359.1 16S rRNA (uracil(1498)-N(3))-methyltransferase [Bacillota bacterium]HOL16199.1 16S rRNA (uracil(1498)-N(3))-methyltransferase [Bacillota bacterium]HPZ10936.1 16S rRNA (uracil(1498)-N(3))-methyltransferase [Bacillota bacterium]HQE09102.1 16S rRNA (uracil(1498)-N(3))-methyltransferase [Bacillota bacterium]